MILANRARKARRYGWCPLCQTSITIGQRITRLGHTWTHAACAAARHRRIVEAENS